MAIEHLHSLTQLLEASQSFLQAAHDAAGAATLVAPSHLWAQQRKLQLRKTLPVGIDVLTLPQLVSQLWDLHGDGTTLISAQERAVLLRPLVTQVGLFDFSPSPGFIDQLGGFVQEATWPGLKAATSLSAAESRVMELVSLYESKLSQLGLIEQAQAEHALLEAGACAGMHLVFERPDLHSAHTRSFLAALEPVVHVTALLQDLSIDAQAPLAPDELTALRQRLFTGLGGVEAQGKVRVGMAQGAHVAPEVTARLVQTMHEQDGIDYAGMLVCCANTADAYPRLIQELAQAHIPFATQFSLPVHRIGLGAAFCALEQLLYAQSDDDAYHALVDIACSPYAGISADDARALQMRWREQAHGTQESRLQDIFQGFEQGNARASVMRERLLPLANLIDAARDERVRLLFDHAQDAHLGVDTMLDACAAAETLLDYLEACERFSCQPDATTMANLQVVLARSYGEQEHALAIVDTQSLGVQPMQALVMCDLDAARYPMARQAGPFDALMTKLGIDRADSLAQDQRIMLLDAIELSQAGFAFTRATHDAAGDESVPSALFEELVSVYRTPADDEASLPVQAIPAALQPWALAISEADALFAPAMGLDEASAMRGALDVSSLAHLACDLKGNVIPFSPTALEDYYRCPYRWFTSRRVGYNGMDVAFDAASQGNLVHAALERFYRDLKQAGHARVTLQNLDEALALASAAFDAQLAHEQSRERRGLYLRTQLDAHACEELRAHVLDIVERDATFLPGFTPTYFELELGRSAGEQLTYAGVPVRGKVDRIDVDGQGNAVIIDYKLSGLSAGYGFSSEDDLPKRIQTDIYAMLVDRHFQAVGENLHVVGSVYRSYAKNVMRGAYAQGVCWGVNEALREDLDAFPRAGDEGYDAYLARVEGVVASCLERLRSGDIKPAPLAPDVCEYCKAALFCPVGGA